MSAAPATAAVSFTIQQGKGTLTIEAATLAELVDAAPLTKKELGKKLKLNPRTFDTRRQQPGTLTQDELHALANALGVPYLDIARLIYEQRESERAQEPASE
ncbi:hypothetical protein GCM10011375_40450 [Hymenobacter qilianensis]|uniref:Uncharacterized protein n=2 Tax=Hymenobacter qilianensis TaxID=1385715 RepID=A0ACB5PXH0_9BACT|nr:hypothetical protein [Hymenobacter qilianensis]QNP54504.1 hypothetical protein H9L05_22365 [Hymenobacter qilianensis]GGF81399.1 hypothetical protein GCM10011375_40450 [Hymenobacter qilianensis]